MDMQTNVAVIVINWNGWRDTVECLESLDSLEYRNFSVVLVDNGSSDGSAEKLLEWATARYGAEGRVADKKWQARDTGGKLLFETAQFTLIATSENLGFSGGSNIAIEYALSRANAPDYVFFLNNDAVPEPDCLNVCLDVSLKQDATIVGTLVKSKDGSRILHTGTKFPRDLFISTRVRLPEDAEESWAVDSPQGCAMLIRRDLLAERKKEAGYYLDPEIFMYGEEMELSIYTARKGHKVLLARDAVVYHGVAQSSGGKISPIVYYYSTRNRVYLARRLLRWWQKLLFHVWYLPTRVIRVIHRLLQGNLRACGALLAGLFDGYIGVGGRWRRHPR